MAGRFGLRLEDIVVAADAGPDELNRADHDLAVVEPNRSMKTSGPMLHFFFKEHLALPSLAVIRLDAATVLLQWAVGGLLFLWVTTRRRRSARLRLAVRGVYVADGAGGFAVGVWLDPVPRARGVVAGVAGGRRGGAGGLDRAAQGREWRASASAIERRRRGWRR